MHKETEQIFSSTGELGISRRQYGRLYINGNRFSGDTEEFDRNFRKLRFIGEKHERIGRSVFRGIVSQDVLQDILSGDLLRSLEVALPLDGFGLDSSWLIYLTQNRSGRDKSIVAPHEMLQETSLYPKQSGSMVERVGKLIEEGYSFIDIFTDAQVDQVFGLWSKTFGWSRQEVENLRIRLERNRQEGVRRNVWFSGIQNHMGELVAVGMAEHLELPGKQKVLHLVESTEWKTRDDYTNRGLITAAIAFLNVQILQCFENQDSQTPLIYAECNFMSRSDRAAHGAGFVIPQRQIQGMYVPQILVQNVAVYDGMAPVGLRDFTFMYAPKETIQNLYTQRERTQIMEFIERG